MEKAPAEAPASLGGKCSTQQRRGGAFVSCVLRVCYERIGAKSATPQAVAPTEIAK